MFEYAETKAQAEMAAQKATESMIELGISPNPNNFAVWYIHHSQRLPDLSREIGRLMSLGAKFTPAVCQSLHDRFVAQVEETRALTTTGERVEQALQQLQRIISAASKGTESYGTTLTSLSDRFEGADGTTVQEIIALLASETQKILRFNRKVGGELARSAEEIRKLNEDLDKMRLEACTDGLTGIANRKTFDKHLHDATEEAQANSTNLSLMMLDIDLFKQFNDTHGHQVGDQVLRLVARTIESSVRPSDRVARYGGEEFAAILPGVPLRKAVEVAERVRTAVANKRITNRRSGTELGRITLSIGIAEFALGESIAMLVQRADKALYLAKRTGRNRVTTQMELETAC